MPTKSCCIPTPVWKSCAGCSSYKIWWTPWRCATLHHRLDTLTLLHETRLGKVCGSYPLMFCSINVSAAWRQVDSRSIKTCLPVSVCCFDVAPDLRGRSLQRPDAAHSWWVTQKPPRALKTCTVFSLLFQLTQDKSPGPRSHERVGVWVCSHCMSMYLNIACFSTAVVSMFTMPVVYEKHQVGVWTSGKVSSHGALF